MSEVPLYGPSMDPGSVVAKAMSQCEPVQGQYPYRGIFLMSDVQGLLDIKDTPPY